MKEYLNLVKHVLATGQRREDRTGTGTISVFGVQTRYDLSQGFPLLTTKKVLFESVVRELIWFLRGSTNINEDLTQHTPIWDAWADERGDLGPIYGYQWRRWERFIPEGQTGLYRRESIDQIGDVIEAIKTNPDSRRLVVSAWNVSDLDKMRLPPCHLLFQFYVSGGRLDLQLYQRSADIALGVPFNIASYSLLLTIVARECGLTPGAFVHTLGDAHIYINHIEGLMKQLSRTPGSLPAVTIAKRPIFELTFEDFKLENYHPQGFIKFPVAV